MSRPIGLRPREGGAIDSVHDASMGGIRNAPSSAALQKRGRSTLSLVVPFYNEEGGIVSFYEAIVPVLEGVRGTSFEIVCVDDGSRDRTLEHLLFLSRKDPRIRVVELSRNFGKEAALTAGIDASEGDAVIPIDADLQEY